MSKRAIYVGGAKPRIVYSKTVKKPIRKPKANTNANSVSLASWLDTQQANGDRS